MIEQLGLQVTAMPKSAGPLTGGLAGRLQTKKKTKPGAYSITWIDTDSEDQVGQVRASAQRIVGEIAKKRGFIAWICTGIGNRLYTIATWGNRESARPEPLSVPLPDLFFADEGRKRDKQEAVHATTTRCPASRESEVLRVRGSNRGQWGQSEARIHPFEGQVEEQETGDQIGSSSVNR